MEGVHPLFLVVLMILSLLHSYADAQGNTISNPPLGITLRDNLKAAMSVMLLGFFTAFVLMFFFRLYLRHCSNGYRAGNNSIAAVDLCGGRFNRQVIDKCPILLYSTVKELKMGKGALECAVCLSEFEECDKIRLLPKCHHVFHPDCIDGWLLAHMNCPVCRAKLTYSDTLLHVAIPVIPTESQQELEGQSSGAVTEGVTETVMEEGTVIPARKSRVLSKFPRSHSTGHSIVGPEEDVENDRYTLVLPEHVRKQILNTSGGLSLPGEWSSKRVWNGERWSVSMTTTPLTLSFNGVQGRAQAPSSNIPPL